MCLLSPKLNIPILNNTNTYTSLLYPTLRVHTSQYQYYRNVITESIDTNKNQLEDIKEEKTTCLIA